MEYSIQSRPTSPKVSRAAGACWSPPSSGGSCRSPGMFEKMPDFFLQNELFFTGKWATYQSVDSDAEVVLEENGPQGLSDGNLDKNQYSIFF